MYIVFWMCALLYSTSLENTRQPTRSLRFYKYGWVALHKQNPFPCKVQRKMIYANYNIRDLIWTIYFLIMTIWCGNMCTVGQQILKTSDWITNVTIELAKRYFVAIGFTKHFFQGGRGVNWFIIWSWCSLNLTVIFIHRDCFYVCSDDSYETYS
jgi:hypothetical protein